jgi:prepilin-type N-terminal cleavage/methylation domain-containing protein
MSRVSISNKRGFTLVEILVGATLSAAVMAAVLSSYIYMGRGLGRLANQQALETDGRRVLAFFERDVRTASSLTDTANLSATRVALIVPTATSTNTITYYYNNTPSAATVSINGSNISMPANALTRCVYNGTTVSALTLLRLRNVNNSAVATRTDLTFRYYDSSGNEYTSYTNYLTGIKQVTVEFSALKGNNSDDSTSSQTAVYLAKSARTVLRNHALLQ